MFLVSHSWTVLSSDAEAIKGWPLSLFPIQQALTSAEWPVNFSHSGLLSYGGAIQSTYKLKKLHFILQLSVTVALTTSGLIHIGLNRNCIEEEATC